ncbi:MAG: deoxyguanosinetriphosphate triphosphohydrolase [Bacillota bacterium]
MNEKIFEGNPYAAEDGLAPYAARSAESLGRVYGDRDAVDPYRTPFQHDRDRILYSTAFRRLQYKTQVYVVHEGDFYRTRLTHSLEVMQHSRTLARALSLNDDLVEAISYAHDIGHPPFGHAGEEALDEIMRDAGQRFEHNLQSLRIVDQLEMRYPDFPGLNLCFETREGLARHSTPYDDPALPEEFKERLRPGLETQVVDVADQVAYCTHDLDDAMNAGLLTEREVRKSGIPVIEEAAMRADREVAKVSDRLARESMWARRLVRHLIEVFSVDIIETTRDNLRRNSIDSVGDVVEREEPTLALSSAMGAQLEILRNWLFDSVYLHPRVLRQVSKGRMILHRLFEAFWDRPRMLHPATWERWRLAEGDEKLQRRILCDHLAGMTDRYAMDLYQALFEPYERIMHRSL